MSDRAHQQPAITNLIFLVPVLIAARPLSSRASGTALTRQARGGGHASGGRRSDNGPIADGHHAAIRMFVHALDSPILSRRPQIGGLSGHDPKTVRSSRHPASAWAMMQLGSISPSTGHHRHMALGGRDDVGQHVANPGNGQGIVLLNHGPVLNEPPFKDAFRQQPRAPLPQAGAHMMATRPRAP
jgi:hypothetical protein